MKLNLLVNLRDISKKWRILQDKRFIYGSIFDQTYENALGTHGLGDLKGIAVGVLGVEGELRDALAVAKVAEDKAAVVAATAHPTGEGDLFAHVLEAKLAAGTGVHGMLIDGTGLAHTSDPPLWICAAPCRSGRRRTDLPSLRKPRSQTWRSILSHSRRCAAKKWLLPKDLTAIFT